jgi:hypothetical protein
MNNKLSISVILPLKSSKARDFDVYFEKAITSLKNQQTPIEELVIVHSQEESLVTLLESYDFGNLNVTKLIWDKNLIILNRLIMV